VGRPGSVLEAYRAFRRKTQAAGNLKSDGKQTVVGREGDHQDRPGGPAGDLRAANTTRAPLVVYGGYSSWGYYPSRLPGLLLPLSAGRCLATGLIWGAAIGAAWHGGH